MTDRTRELPSDGRRRTPMVAALAAITAAALTLAGCATRAGRSPAAAPDPKIATTGPSSTCSAEFARTQYQKVGPGAEQHGDAGSLFSNPIHVRLPAGAAACALRIEVSFEYRTSPHDAGNLQAAVDLHRLRPNTRPLAPSTTWASQDFSFVGRNVSAGPHKIELFAHLRAIPPATITVRKVVLTVTLVPHP